MTHWDIVSMMNNELRTITLNASMLSINGSLSSTVLMVEVDEAGGGQSEDCPLQTLPAFANSPEGAGAVVQIDGQGEAGEGCHSGKPVGRPSLAKPAVDTNVGQDAAGVGCHSGKPAGHPSSAASHSRQAKTGKGRHSGKPAGQPSSGKSQKLTSEMATETKTKRRRICGAEAKRRKKAKLLLEAGTGVDGVRPAGSTGTAVGVSATGAPPGGCASKNNRASGSGTGVLGQGNAARKRVANPGPSTSTGGH